MINSSLQDRSIGQAVASTRRGFLDPHAISIQAEYMRYLDRDILGKIIFKNFARNILGLGSQHGVKIPLSRHGDSGTGKDPCDVVIRFDNRSYNVETKCSYHIVAHKVTPAPRWMFSGTMKSRSGQKRSNYDLLFGVGIDLPGLEESVGYWRQLNDLKAANQAEGRLFELSTWPHEAPFLNLCGFLVMPRRLIRTNHMDFTIRNLPMRAEYEFFAWGKDSGRCRDIWRHAIKSLDSSADI